MLKKTSGNKNPLIKIFIFGTISLLFGFLFVFGLINNSNGAVERYNKLIAVDKAGGDVESALNELRTYIYSHMNTELGGPNGIYPPVQLKGTYERLTQAEQQKAKQVNDNLYSEAQRFCEANGSQGFSGRNRIDCINKYVDDNGVTAEPIDDSLYKYDFVSPIWSPDLAGFSLIIFIAFLLITIYYTFVYFRIRYMVNIGK